MTKLVLCAHFQTGNLKIAFTITFVNNKHRKSRGRLQRGKIRSTSQNQLGPTYIMQLDPLSKNMSIFFFYLTYLLQRSIFQDGRRFPLKSVTSDVKKNHIKKSYKDMAFKFALCIHRVYPKIHAKYQLIQSIFVIIMNYFIPRKS